MLYTIARNDLALVLKNSSSPWVAFLPPKMLEIPHYSDFEKLSNFAQNALWIISMVLTSFLMLFSPPKVVVTPGGI